MKVINPPSLRQQFPIKMLIPALLAMVFFVFLVFAVLIPYFENALMDKKREMIHDLVVTTESGIQRFYEHSLSGELSVEEAQQGALEHIRALHYGMDGENYFWVQTFEPIMLAHPIRSLEGNDVSLLSEPIDGGRAIFSEMTEKVVQYGEGFSDYVWDAPNGQGIIPKIAYVKRFEPWDWIIGTDISFEDVFIEISDIVKRLTITISVILFFISGLLAYNVFTGLRSERNREKAEANLAVSEEKFRTLVDHVPVGIYRNEKTPLGKCTMVNPGFQEMFHFKSILKAKQKDLGDFFLKDSDAQIFSVALTELGEITDFEVRLKKENKGYIWANLSARTVMEPNGYIYFDGIIENITERKKAALAQKQAFEKLKKLDKEKDEFIAVASHEMRTPLGVIKGYAALLLTKLNQGMQPTQLGLITKIKGNVERLTGIVNDMLDVQKIEGGDQTKTHPVELNPFITQIVEDFQISAGGKKITLTYTDNPKVGFVMGDEEKLKQMFNNLIGNAIKFVQESGHIWVSAQDDINSKDYIRISVKDDGKGIPKKDQKRIFEKFQQVEDHTKHTETGTGLGLAICKKVVTQIFKGKLWVESEEGKGSEFIFTILKATSDDRDEFKKTQSLVVTSVAPQSTVLPVSEQTSLVVSLPQVDDVELSKKKAEVLAKLAAASAPAPQTETPSGELSAEELSKKKAEILAKLAAASAPAPQPEIPSGELSAEDFAKKKAEVLAKLKNMQ